MRQIGLAAAAGLLLSSASFGYYHFVHYLNRTGPFVPSYEKFDLNALPNRTVQFNVSDQAPAQFAPSDSFQAVVSQIRAAAKVWNGVESSDLRIAFGGLGNTSTPQATPGIDVVFDEVPPGLVAMGGPTLRADAVPGPAGAFVPIARSLLVVRRDLSTQPSYSETFFLTLVHEFGHTLGLQHTLTSSVMSTQPTRAASKSKPLAADDVAALSLLYPTPGFAASTGVITGRVTMGGEAVTLASVVAISPNGLAVSALTNPDGSYRIEGLPAGIQYWVYVHPLPPALSGEVSPANIVLPLDATGRAIQPGPAYFDTIFFPGTKNPAQAFVFSVAAGQTLDNVNLSVQRRTSLPLYAVQTYSFPGQVAVRPATLNRNSTRSFLVAAGAGLSVNNAPAPGLSVSVLGGAAGVQPGRPYAPAPAYVQFDVSLTPFSSEGYYHMVFSLGGDIYVLPSAFQVASRPAPVLATLAAVTDATGARVVAVTGTNLTAETRFLFDGQPAVRVVEDAGHFLLTPPSAAAGYRAALVAVNPDGQNSLQIQTGPAMYQYESGDSPLAALSPAALPAGSEGLVEINAPGANFADGQVQIGFGSTDVVVRRLWVVSPTRILANVYVSPQALALPGTVTVTSGLQMVAQPFAFQVQPANPRQLTLSSQVMNAATGQAGVQSGQIALVAAPSLTQAQIAAGLTLTFNGAPVQIVNAAPGQVAFVVPAGASSGPVVLRLQAGAEASLPIAITVDPPSPVVVSALTSGLAVDATRPVRPAELVTLVVGNLGDSPSAARMRLMVAGIDHQIALVVPASGQPGMYQVAFFLNPAVPAGAQPVLVSLDGRISTPFPLLVRGQ
ncbi:MAG: matrixin family metalloprotease [Acidobacteria bacterium]|nr:matrixin family metalloprotease [Acidobacteriota bacterium]